MISKHELYPKIADYASEYIRNVFRIEYAQQYISRRHIPAYLDMEDLWN